MMKVESGLENRKQYSLHFKRIIEFTCEERHLVILCNKTLEEMFSRTHNKTEKKWNGRKVCRLRKTNRKINVYIVGGRVVVLVGTVPKNLPKPR